MRSAGRKVRFRRQPAIRVLVESAPVRRRGRRGVAGGLGDADGGWGTSLANDAGRCPRPRCQSGGFSPRKHARAPLWQQFTGWGQQSTTGIVGSRRTRRSAAGVRTGRRPSAGLGLDAGEHRRIVSICPRLVGRVRTVSSSLLVRVRQSRLGCHPSFRHARGVAWSGAAAARRAQSPVRPGNGSWTLPGSRRAASGRLLPSRGETADLAGVGKRVISPISATNTAAKIGPTPAMAWIAA